jgi:hypothetical protein
MPKTQSQRSRRDCCHSGKVAGSALADIAVCWEVATNVGSLRVLASISSGIGEAVRQLRPSFQTPFLFVLSRGSCDTAQEQQVGAGGRWQLGTGAWEPLPPLIVGRGGFLSGNVEGAVIKGGLHVLAEAITHGRKGYCLQRFDPACWAWSLLVNVISGEYEALVELDDHLHILGRNLSARSSWQPQLLRYSTLNGLESLPTMSTARCYTGAGVLNGRLYAVGGYACNRSILDTSPLEPLQEAERFSPCRGQHQGVWETLPPMQCSRFMCKALAVRGCLYVLGGLSSAGNEMKVERYDPTSNVWSILAPLPSTRWALDVTEHHGRILVFGGKDDKGAPQEKIERYDPLTNRWSTLPKVGASASVQLDTLLVPFDDCMMAVCAESDATTDTLVIREYNEFRGGLPAVHRLPPQRGRVRAVMSLGAE